MNLTSKVRAIMNPENLWPALAMSSTSVGNLTILGSVANLIVAESAGRKGIKLGFFEYLKSGIPISILTLLIGILRLNLI